jgi:hypothetical protein
MGQSNKTWESERNNPYESKRIFRPNLGCLTIDEDRVVLKELSLSDDPEITEKALTLA